MSDIEEKLKSGGHTNSLGRAEEVLNEVREDNTKLPELYSCISSGDAWVRMRAVDTFEKLVREKPLLSQPYLADIFEKLTKSSQPSIQWHIAQIFAVADLSASQREAAIEWLKDKIKTVEIDWIVSVNTMKTLLKFNKEGQVDKSSLITLFQIQTKHKSKSVRKKTNIFIEQLS